MIPKANKLPSGNWYCRVKIDGISHCITRKTKNEAIMAAIAFREEYTDSADTSSMTVTQAIDRYIDERSNMLSPSTVRGYRAIQKNRFQSMMQRPISKVTQHQWAVAVNKEVKKCSPKTLKNAWAFISSVIRHTTGKIIKVNMPQEIPHELPWLTAEQIPVFLDAIKGTDIEISALLALEGLRRSELLAVTWDDIDIINGTVTVHGAMVEDENSQLVFREENKNKTSRRVVPFLIPQLREAVIAADKTSKYVVTIPIATMFQHINKICRENDLPEVGVHGLRRSFASLCYHLGVSQEVAMRAGGWSTVETMRRIYTKISDKDTIREAGKLDGFFEKCNESVMPE